MTEMLFDTQKMVDRLEEAGVPPSQARAHAALLFDVISSLDGHCTERYATKDAVSRAQETLEARVNSGFAEVKAEFVAVRAEMQAALSKLKSDLMKWVLVVGVSLSFLQIGFVSALILKLLP